MRPIYFDRNDVMTGPRIGGASPLGLDENFRDEHTQYFGTFPIPTCHELEFSIFHRMDMMGVDSLRDTIANNNQVVSSGELIWCVVHDASRRGSEKQNEFEPCGLIVGPETEDLTDDCAGNMTPYAQSKLGGSCFVFRYQIRQAIDDLNAKGYHHLIQIGQPASRIIDGFPWDPGFLNVWASNSIDSTTYRFCVQQ